MLGRCRMVPTRTIHFSQGLLVKKVKGLFHKGYLWKNVTLLQFSKPALIQHYFQNGREVFEMPHSVDDFLGKKKVVTYEGWKAVQKKSYSFLTPLKVFAKLFIPEFFWISYFLQSPQMIFHSWIFHYNFEDLRSKSMVALGAPLQIKIFSISHGFSGHFAIRWCPCRDGWVLRLRRIVDPPRQVSKEMSFLGDSCYVLWFSLARHKKFLRGPRWQESNQ